MKIKLTKKQKQNIKLIAGISLIVGIFMLLLFAIVYAGIEIGQLLTDDKVCGRTRPLCIIINAT